MRNMPITLAFACLLALSLSLARAAEDPKDALQGVWIAQSGERDGAASPAEDIKSVKITITADKFTLQEKDEKDMECAYKIDTTQSPKQLDLTPANKENKPVHAIYELKGDELKICARQADSSDGPRPTEFATKKDSHFALLVLKREKK
ncbi:MAG TPA: TIGR03067 domain-containing protein [Planctomycetota bacterium]|nr:TIGR03067 domain-containing protein [Planctomycetota bacterium]